MQTFDDLPLLPERIATPGEALPPLPDVAYPPDTTPLVPFDSATGEVIEGELVGDDLPAGDFTDRALIPLRLAQGSARAVHVFRDPEAVRGLTRELQTDLLARLRQMDVDARAARREGRITASVVAPELQLWGDAYETLDAISRAIAAGAKEARALAGEVVAEVEPEKVHGSASVRVGDGHGQDVKVTRTQPTEVAADTDKILDVLVAALADALPDRKRTQALDVVAADGVAYARGARDALTQLQQLVSPLKWKTTALDAWARRLDDAEQYDLGVRLGHAYGRVAKGNPTVKIERVEPSTRGAKA